nr:hypothetical protein [Streptomyces sp. AC550_RSS872]
MPVELLTDEQAEAYGKFAEWPTRPEPSWSGSSSWATSTAI